MTIPPNHAEQAWQSLNEGLSLADQGNLAKAIDALFYAATRYERNQEYRTIPGIWEKIGELLETIERQKENSSLSEQPAVSTQNKHDIEYRVISDETWNQFSSDSIQRLAWVYQWAAEHRERASDWDTAQKLYFKAAGYMEKSPLVLRDRPHWAARMYYRAVLNHIRFFGMATESEPKEGVLFFGPLRKRVKGSSGPHTGDVDVALQKMYSYWMQYAEKTKRPARAHKHLAMSYASLKSALLERGNLPESQRMEQEEIVQAREFYKVSGNYRTFFYYWLRSGGHTVIFLGWFLAIIIIFPLAYLYFGLLNTHTSSPASFCEAVLYSAECALIIDHQAGALQNTTGYWTSIAETASSYFILGGVLWYLTRKIESPVTEVSYAVRG